MTKALVSVDMDLASGIALRYAYQLANLIKIKLGTIHVENPDVKENVPTAGWVHKKWENALMQKEQEEIAALLNTPKLYSPFVWSRPIAAVGNREQEILNHLKKGFYDIYIEGRLATYSITKFYNIFDSLLYKNLTVPVIMVKNLVEIHELLILMDDDVDASRIVSNFIKIFGNVKIKIDLLYYKAGNSKEMEELEDSRVSAALENVQNLLNTKGLSVRTCQVVRGTPKQISRSLRNYGLVISSIRWPVDRKRPLVELLGRVLCPIFLSWQ